MRRIGWIGLLLGTLWVSPVPAKEKHTLIFLVDSSQGMNERLAGETRLDAARRVLKRVIREIGDRQDVGLATAGGDEAKGCAAIDMAAPAGVMSVSELTAVLDGWSPSGQRPLADAVNTAVTSLETLQGPKSVVVIAGGRDTCGADLLETVKRIHEKFPDVILHIVGLGVSSGEQETLARAASLGGGNYYSANDLSALAESLKSVSEAENVRVLKELARDDFEGVSLNEMWSVRNPNQDSLLVEDGFLQILTDLPADNLFEPTNLVLWSGGLPKEWEAILRLRFSLKSARSTWYENQVAGLMLYQDSQNGIMLAISNDWGDNGYWTDAVHFKKVRDGAWVPGFSYVLGKSEEEREVVLRLQRQGRNFVGWVLDEKGQWQKIGEFPELKPQDYRMGIFALRGSGEARESLMKFDEFILSAVEP